MKLSARQAALSLAGVAVLLFVFHSWAARVQWERDRAVELCVDGAEIQLLTDQNDVETWRMLENVRTAGVSSVAVYWDPTRPLSDLMEEWAPRVPDGVRLTLRPEPVPFSDWSKGWPRAALPLKIGAPHSKRSFFRRFGHGVSRDDARHRMVGPHGIPSAVGGVWSAKGHGGFAKGFPGTDRSGAHVHRRRNAPGSPNRRDEPMAPGGAGTGGAVSVCEAFPRIFPSAK